MLKFKVQVVIAVVTSSCTHHSPKGSPPKSPSRSTLGAVDTLTPAEDAAIEAGC